MHNQFPFTIETKYGEKINFLRMEGDRLILEGFCEPMAGPGMHVHLRQDEGVTVVKGKIGYQILGKSPGTAARETASRLNAAFHTDSGTRAKKNCTSQVGLILPKM